MTVSASTFLKLWKRDKQLRWLEEGPKNGRMVNQLRRWTQTGSRKQKRDYVLAAELASEASLTSV